MLQPGDNAFQTGFVVRYPALQCDKVSVPGAFAVRREYVPLQNVPFRRKQLMTAADLPGYTVMDYLIEQSAFPIRNGRGPEFYFYGCHTFRSLKLSGQGNEQACNSIFDSDNAAGRAMFRPYIRNHSLACFARFRISILRAFSSRVRCSKAAICCVIVMLEKCALMAFTT